MPSYTGVLMRLLMALLLAAFAMPVAGSAACHDAPAPTHAMPMADHTPEHRALPAPVCIGCIPPSDWFGPRIAQSSPSLLASPVAAAPAVLTGASPPPDLRPPRAG
jgi:hypothetical protein